MRWVDRYAMAWSWVEPGSFLAGVGRLCRETLVNTLLIASGLSWVACSPVLALWGVYHPARLQRLIRWVRHD